MPSTCNAKSRRPVRYHLRATLTPEHHEAEEAALWQVLRQGQFDEVLFFVPHAEERSSGLGTDADNARLVEILAPLFERLRAAGIAPSINIWWTVAFSEFAGMPRDLRDSFNFRWAVTIDGRESRAVACPRCPAWRAQVVRMYQAYASLKPVRIWIDDDVRMTLRADLHSPCFCDSCLAAMQARTGTRFTRDELLTGILADPPNPVREAWLAEQEQLMLDIVTGLATGVHAASPETHVSLMHSGPEHHSAEGRNWARLVAALGQPTPMLRPSIGTYTEGLGPAFAAALNCSRRSLAAYPPGVEVAPEIETYPQSRFGKSVASVTADLVLAQLLGVREMTFSIYRFGGRLDLEIAREDVWSELLGRLKPKLQALADLGITPAQQRGIGLYWHEQEARHARSVQQQSKPIFLYRQHPWDQTLPLFGLATSYGPSRVMAFAGEQVACLSDAERERVFAGGVLLDARAAEELLLLGCGDLAGIARRLPDTTAAVETIEDAAFGGLAGDVINCRWTSQPWQFECLPGTRAVSRLRGYRHEDHGHGVLVCENRLGGRVVVVPFDSQAGAASGLGLSYPALESPSFLCRARQAQLRAALEWATRGPLPLVVEDAPLAYPLLIEQPRRLIIGVANLMPDAIAKLTLCLATPTAFVPKRLRVLTREGKWRACRRAEIATDPVSGTTLLRTDLALPYLDVATLILD